MNYKEKNLRKRLVIMAVLAVVFAVLAVVCSLIGFSGNTPKEDAKPDPTKETVQVIPKATEPVDVTQPGSLPEETEPEQEPLPPIPIATEPVDVTQPASLPEETEPEQEPLPLIPVTTETEDTTRPIGLSETADRESSAPTAPASEALHRMKKADTAAKKEEAEHGNVKKTVFRIAACVFLIACITDVFMMILIIKNMRQYKQRVSTTVNSYETTVENPSLFPFKSAAKPVFPIPGISLGKLHNVGKRDYQQDSFGHMPVLNNQGVLAILADGMGGLSNGEKVSQSLVMECMNFGAAMTNTNHALEYMLDAANQKINAQLGPEGLRKSGSTIVSVLIEKNKLHWLSVGDSRIYLYRDRYLSQITRDHDLFQQWMPEILEGTRSLEESLKDMEGRKLTSFIGMGNIRYVDRSLTPITLVPGDRILLMSDGIYGVVSDESMENILRTSENVQEAANQIAACVAQVNSSYQDNYTLIVLGYDPEQ